MPQKLELKKRIRRLRDTYNWKFRDIAAHLQVSEESAWALYRSVSTKRYIAQCLYCNKKHWLLSPFRKHVVECALRYFAKQAK